MYFRISSYLLILITALVTAGCGGSLYRVKAPVTAALPADAPLGSSSELEVRAAPLKSDDESDELFGANLPLAGVLPVRIEFANTGQSAIDLARAQFRLSDSGGRNWSARSAKQAAQRVMDYDKVYLYNPSSRKEYFRAMQAHEFDLKTPLGAGERRSGFLFFRGPGKEPIDRPSGLSLTINKLAQPVQITLN